ncbi:class I SAM-dependent methyltransferase [Marinactinospora thermotolerans]|uniref:Methylase involved in ubiquinone/menaquinone biosynthesis n=2 Tax=Marinactinospora thermotolerans TaxID=531310 RepID=A0A1T4T424_9ACTN|nr:class I SAM-dependent methyltransferase [Marinactinospora thermotolerans]AET51863.1 methyltransferase [Marinactinospora thermotolerans]SKA35176.1 Methylase involved in ubiquinone/menaquinone biosynthesis [Marinactinospora thermotolerans DSM 45154]
MIRWARRSEACSDAFTAYCHEHALVDRNDNVNRYWEYPWAATHAGLRPGMRVLDAGAGYSPFLLHLAETVPDAEYHAADPAYAFQTPAQLPHARIDTRPLEELAYPDGHFDLIFCLSVLEHLDASARLAAVRALARCLRPGGRLVLTVDYFLDWPRWRSAIEQKPRMAAWLPDGNPDVARMVRASGLHPLAPDRIDPHPGTEGFEEGAVHDDLWWSEHIGAGLRVTSLGLVLHRPLAGADDRGLRLRISPEALHLRDDGTPLFADHHGTGAAPQRYVLPPRALDPEGFTAGELVEWLGGGTRAEAVVERALRWRTLRPAGLRPRIEACQPDSFREVYRNPEGTGVPRHDKRGPA